MLVSPIIVSVKNACSGTSVADLIKERKFEELVNVQGQAVEPLIALLKERDINVRNDAVDTLGKIGEIAIKPLIDDLRADYNNHRWDCQRALSTIGTPSVEPLIKSLEHSDAKFIKYAVIALGNIGDAAAVEPLISLLAHQDPRVREWTAKSLGMLGDAHAVSPLISALADADVSVRSSAALALAELRDVQSVEKLLLSLEDGEWEVRRDSAFALGEMKDKRAVEPLIALLNDKDAWVRDEAKRALAKIGESSVDPLIKIMKDGKNTEKKYAANALGMIGNKKSVDVLLNAVENNDKAVQKASICALGALKAEAAITPIINKLMGNDLGVRYCTTYALTMIGNPSVKLLIHAAKEDAKVGAEPIINVLGIIGDNSAAEYVISTLESDSISIRRASARALARINDDRSVAPLILKLTDKDEFVRYYAANALRNKKWKAENKAENLLFLFAYQEWGELIKLKREAFDTLIDALLDGSKSIRINSATTLGKMGDTAAIASLASLLDDDEKKVKAAALEALKKLTKEDFGYEKDLWLNWKEKK